MSLASINMSLDVFVDNVSPFLEKQDFKALALVNKEMNGLVYSCFLQSAIPPEPPMWKLMVAKIKEAAKKEFEIVQKIAVEEMDTPLLLAPNQSVSNIMIVGLRGTVRGQVRIITRTLTSKPFLVLLVGSILFEMRTGTNAFHYFTGSPYFEGTTGWISFMARISSYFQ